MSGRAASGVPCINALARRSAPLRAENGGINAGKAMRSPERDRSSARARDQNERPCLLGNGRKT